MSTRMTFDDKTFDKKSETVCHCAPNYKLTLSLLKALADLVLFKNGE